MKVEKVTVIEDIPLNNITVDELSNIRMETDDVSGLMESIKQHGLEQPVGVFEHEPGNYKLIWGHRRLKAFEKLGNRTIPAIVLDQPISEDKFLILNAIENTHRKDIQPIELGRICAIFKERGYSLLEISALLSLPKSTIEDALNLYLHAPIAWVKKVTSRNKKAKSAGLNVTVANFITRMHIGAEKKDKLFKIAMEQDYTRADLEVIRLLVVLGGLTIDEAISKKNDFIVKNIELIFYKQPYFNLLKKTRKKPRAIIIDAISNKYPEIIFDKKLRS